MVMMCDVVKAIKLINDGHKMSRKHWDNDGQYIFRTTAATVTETKRCVNIDIIIIKLSNGMYKAWTPILSDIESHDWYIVNG